MRLTSTELATAAGGEVRGPATEIDGASIDTRTLQPGQLFVAVRGERDGHEFVGAAVGAGAAACLVEQPVGDGPEIVVPDTSAALLDLGRLARSRLPEAVVGITGSVGKTSVKDLAASAIGAERRVAASDKSFNNELGVPLTLLNAAGDTEAAIIEMGARGIGHIELLCFVASPTVGVVTAVVAAHTELFGTVDDVARAKGELVEALPANGTAVLNADDERVAAMAKRSPAPALTYSAAARTGADLLATDVRLDDELRPSFRLQSPWGEVDVSLTMRGLHQVGNALAAAGAALALGVELGAVAGGLAQATPSPWRMDLQRTASGALVLNDAYNANPASMAAALEALAALPARRRIAVVGTMAELGATSADEHRAIAALAADAGIELIAVDEAAYGTDVVRGLDGALAALGELGAGDAVLVKASRVAGLERLAAALLSR